MESPEKLFFHKQLMARVAVFLFCSCFSFALGAAVPQQQSKYAALASDVAVTEPYRILLQTTITLNAPDKIYVQSDGYIRQGAGTPGSAGRVAGGISIVVDSAKIGSDAVVDWPEGRDGQVHSYNVIGAAELSAGTHTVSLVAASLLPSSSSFTVGAGSNLSVFVHPADRILVTTLSDPTDTYGDYLVADRSVDPPVPINVSNWERGTPLPVLEPLRLTVPATDSPVVAMSSARVFGESGDVLLGIGLNGKNPGNAYSSWSVNDMGYLAEYQAPVFSHAYFPKLAPDSRISMQATVFPWEAPYENPAIYKIGAGAKLIVMYGGMQVTGHSVISDAVNDPWDLVCVKWPNCSRPSLTAEDAVFTVPEGHHGVVMFSAKARVQEQVLAGTYGRAAIRIGIWDATGIKIGEGSVGMQRIADPLSISQRTLSSSYLATGAKALKPGIYRARVELAVWSAPGENPLNNLDFRSDMPLLWFD